MDEIELHAMRAYLDHLHGYICELAKSTPCPALPEEPEEFIRKYLERPLGDPFAPDFNDEAKAR